MSNVRTDSFAHYVNGEFVLRNVAARAVPVTSDVHVSDDEYVTVGIEYYPRPDYYPRVRAFLSIVSGGECVLSAWLSDNRVGSVLVRGTVGSAWSLWRGGRALRRRCGCGHTAIWCISIFCMRWRAGGGVRVCWLSVKMDDCLLFAGTDMSVQSASTPWGNVRCT